MPTYVQIDADGNRTEVKYARSPLIPVYDGVRKGTVMDAVLRYSEFPVSEWAKTGWPDRRRVVHALAVDILGIRPGWCASKVVKMAANKVVRGRWNIMDGTGYRLRDLLDLSLRGRKSRSVEPTASSVEGVGTKQGPDGASAVAGRTSGDGISPSPMFPQVDRPGAVDKFPL